MDTQREYVGGNTSTPPPANDCQQPQEAAAHDGNGPPLHVQPPPPPPPPSLPQAGAPKGGQHLNNVELATGPLQDESQAARSSTSTMQAMCAKPAQSSSSFVSVDLDSNQPAELALTKGDDATTTTGQTTNNTFTDLESNTATTTLGNTNKQVVRKPAALKSLRYYIMLLALVSPFIVTYSRTIINFAIIDMIVPPPEQEHNTPNNDTIHLDYFDMDNSCPVDDVVRERLRGELESDRKRSTGSTGEKFDWDTDKQGYLKAAYPIGHMILQVVGGRLSEIYGSQLIMSLSACFIALCCLYAPYLASIHFYLIFADLFVLGIVGSFMTPALITLISNWLTPGEKSLMMSFYLVSSRLGSAFSSLLCGLLIEAQLSWRYLFYSAGLISLTFGCLFALCSRNRPHEHPLISQLELDYLASKNKLVREAIRQRDTAKLELESQEMKPIPGQTAPGGQSDKHTNNNGNNKQTSTKPRQPPAPWFAILTNVPVWAFIITKFCVKLMGDTVGIELPAYLKRVMHMPSRYNGYINSANYAIFCVSCIGVGTLAKWANKKRPFGSTKTVVRKMFQCTASFGVALVLLGASLSVCMEATTLALFMAMFFLTTFSTGGEAQIPLDLSERYAGTIHALGGTLAISGVIEPIMVGQFLLGHAADKQRWANIWLGASAISLAGGFIFLFFGEAKIQPFDEIEVKRDHNKHNASDKQDQPVEAGLTKVLNDDNSTINGYQRKTRRSQ